MYYSQSQTNDQPAKGAMVDLLGGHTKNRHDKNEGQHDLRQQSGNDAAVNTGKAMPRMTKIIVPTNSETYFLMKEFPSKFFTEDSNHRPSR